MNKALTVGVILSLVLGVGFLVEMQKDITIVSEEATHETVQTRELDVTVGTSDMVEISKELKLTANISGVWIVSDSKHCISIPRADFNKSGFFTGAYDLMIDVSNPQVILESNSTFMLENERPHAFKYLADDGQTSQTIWKKLETIEGRNLRILKKAYALASYEAYMDKQKACGYVLDRTKELCAAENVKVYAFLTKDGKHVAPVIKCDLLFEGFQSQYLYSYFGLQEGGVYAEWETTSPDPNGSVRLVHRGEKVGKEAFFIKVYVMELEDNESRDSNYSKNFAGYTFEIT
jgi:hypothetical protein